MVQICSLHCAYHCKFCTWGWRGGGGGGACPEKSEALLVCKSCTCQQRNQPGVKLVYRNARMAVIAGDMSFGDACSAATELQAPDEQDSSIRVCRCGWDAGDGDEVVRDVRVAGTELQAGWGGARSLSGCFRLFLLCLFQFPLADCVCILL